MLKTETRVYIRGLVLVRIVHMMGLPSDKVKVIFEFFDKDGDGKLNGEELSQLIQGVNPAVEFTGEQINTIIKEVCASDW